MKKTLTILALAALAVGCAKQPTPQELEVQADAAEAAIGALLGDPNAKGTIEGIEVPGTALTAKAAGFTDCRAIEQFREEALECHRPKSKLAGVRAADAFVVLSLPDGDATASMKLADYRLEQLSYSEVTFQFTPLLVADTCEKGKSSQASAEQIAELCDDAGTQMDLADALEAQGWVRASGSELTDEERYFHTDQTVVIASQPFDPVVKVRAVGVEMRDSAIDTAKSAEADEKAEKAAKNALIDGMKSAG